MSVSPATWPAAMRNAIRTSNKFLLNPVMLVWPGVSTGTPRWSSTPADDGKTYRTPVVADRADGNLIIPLPYGTASTGCATSCPRPGHRGESRRNLRCRRPRIVGADVALPLLPPQQGGVCACRRGTLLTCRSRLRTSDPAALIRLNPCVTASAFLHSGGSTSQRKPGVIDEDECRHPLGYGGDWTVEEIDLDPPREGEVLVSWEATGLCHSDEHFRTGDLPARCR
jgi:hypothetical protein